MTARPHERDEEPEAAVEPLDAELRRMIQEALDDPRPPIPADEAFAQVHAHIAEYKAKHGC
jgi:hypothetical protein